MYKYPPHKQLIDMEMEVCNEQTANKLGSTITNFLSNLNNDNTSQSKPTPTVETNGELVDKTSGDGREEMPIITPKTQQAINRGITPKSQQVINNTFTTPTATTATPSASNSGIVSPLSNKGAESPSRGDVNTTTSPSTPSQSPSSRLDAEYFSSKNYSRKKSAEMKVMFAKKQRAVSDIINAMNERGIGGVNLKNVQVEAFIHPSLRKEKEELEGDGEFMEMLGKALDERNTGEGGEGTMEVGIDGSGDGMGEEEQTISSEQAMAGGVQGGMATPSTAQRQQGIRESEQNPYVLNPESSETYLEQAFKSSRGVTRDPNSPNNKNVTPDPASLVADQIADTYETEHNRVITGDGQGMEYRDTLNSEAYKMNASKNAKFRKMGSKGGNGPPVNQDFEKDINDVVNDMADKQSKVRPLTNGEYAAPMKDAESEEYERQLKQQLNENKKDRLNIQPPPSRGYGGGAKASRSPRSTPTNVDVELSNESNRLASETSSKQNAKVVSSENDDEYMAKKRAQAEFAEAAAKQAAEGEGIIDEVDRVPDDDEEGKVNPMDTTDAAIILSGEEDEEEGNEAVEEEGDDQIKEDPPAENEEEEEVEVELEDVKLDEPKGDIEEANKKKAKDKTPQPIESVMDVPPQGTCCTCSCVIS